MASKAASASEVTRIAESNPGGEGRFFELDILRGFASYLVVIFHYKHFLYSDALGFDYAHLPFLSVLEPVYVYGQFFVELFFSISGYVFFWLYAKALAERKMGVRSFFIARFSRLYPLFFATFIAVAIIQWAFHALYGYDYIYQHNTPGNFALNLFMVSLQWDPYPFILLNLAFSTQAAYAAPLILLAQNRQDDRDRISLEEDRARAAQTTADTEFMARELAALRIAVGEVATRDYLRSELDRLRAELAGTKKRERSRKSSTPSAEQIRDDPRWDDEESVTHKS